MIFFSTKDLFFKHIFEHFILQLLEAFKRSNSPSLPRNFPCRLECRGFFAHFQRTFCEHGETDETEAKLKPMVKF